MDFILNVKITSGLAVSGREIWLAYEYTGNSSFTESGLILVESFL